MSSVTYQTLVPDSLVPFCEAMAAIMPRIERHLYQDLQRGLGINQLKREYQLRYGINARQFNAINVVCRGKIRSRQECYQRQINNLKSQINSLESSQRTKKKKLTNRKRQDYVAPACPLKVGSRTPRQQLRFTIHQQQRKLHRLKAKLQKLLNTSPKIIFGGRKLWQAQYNLEANGYSCHAEWLKDWQEYRNSQFDFVGSKDESAGCQVFQLSSDGTIKIRVPSALSSGFGKYVIANKVQFAYGQADINWTLQNQKAISYRFARQDNKWYIFATVDKPEVPYQSHRRNGAIGVDLNPAVIGWAYCDESGNLKAKGQFRVNLQDRTTDQTLAIIGDVCVQLVKVAARFSCPIVIENLDFERKKAQLKYKGKKYARMLSNFAYSTFDAMLRSRCERFGIELIHVNPAYSSLIGLVKFMRMYGLSSDTAAALVLARRALRKSERIPAKSAFVVSVDAAKHVWSLWNALAKKLRGVKRHSFFNYREANSLVEVIRQCESEQSDRHLRKLKGTSTGEMKGSSSNR